MNTLDTINAGEIGALLIDLRRLVGAAHGELRAFGRQALPFAVEVYHRANAVGAVVDGTLELDNVDGATRNRIDHALNELLGLYELVE